MKNIFRYWWFFLLLFFFFKGLNLYAQQVPIINYSTNNFGQVQLQVNSTSQNYYITKVKHEATESFLLPTSITLGKVNTTTIEEPAQYYPVENYQVLSYTIENPFDTDNDGIDDMVEYNNAPQQSPFNAAIPINIEDGLVMIDSFETFQKLSVKKDFVQWSEFLNGKQYVKFIITDIDKPKLYFINSKNHKLHADFAEEINIEQFGNSIKKGQIIFHPQNTANNGELGAFAFNYSNGKPQNFKIVQATYELLAANMPFLKNNLSYFVTANSEAQYADEETLFNQSRVPVLFEEDVYAEINYLGLHEAEGYGFLRLMTLEEIPGLRDIVLYETLPNSLPHVSGIITTAIQTPLSHVNLRAIQNNIPNAYIKNATAIEKIKNLINNYIYFKVENDNYYIREATLTEVNNWFENIRPTEEQHPLLNLNRTKILPLNDIDFSMFDAYGAKCANVATMHSFDFPNETIPNGFGIPFYYYNSFMQYNSFFEMIGELMESNEFKTNRTVREKVLKDFRKKIKSADMPNWMMNDLATMHATFPMGIAVRCRSSSNNEDIPGFNGAGLYDSKTQHTDEGHISKSIKQVYASLWNLRAFEEREFYKINHLKAAMGVLCHHNFSNEKANGVAISTDPFYNTTNTFYINTQVGEDLITNPESNSIPEEILLNNDFSDEAGYAVIQYSNLTPTETTILNQQHLKELRNYLQIIHHQFKQLYRVAEDDEFAMDVEYKITNENNLSIKQARPWIHNTDNNDDDDNSNNENSFDLTVFPNPAQVSVSIQCSACNINSLTVSNITGQVLLQKSIDENFNSTVDLLVDNLSAGVYFLSSFTAGEKHYQTVRFLKH